MSDLLHDLLSAGPLRWSNGHTTLTVVNSWNTFSQSKLIRTTYEVQADASEVRLQEVFLDLAMRVPFPMIEEHIGDGVCTHQDVRDALKDALRGSAIADRVRARWAETTRHTIIINSRID
ncbi:MULTISPECIES: hypothetical protein [Saccharothrix]|uniref:hypothetical protein n=1 Tax=Saccharothrix TaxID=2071 RepID=UPI0009390421|nr:hypothetical protein [Saccharothrix sp. CB00851]